MNHRGDRFRLEKDEGAAAFIQQMGVDHEIKPHKQTQTDGTQHNSIQHISFEKKKQEHGNKADTDLKDERQHIENRTLSDIQRSNLASEVKGRLNAKIIETDSSSHNPKPKAIIKPVTSKPIFFIVTHPKELLFCNNFQQFIFNFHSLEDEPRSIAFIPGMFKHKKTWKAGCLPSVCLRDHYRG